MTNSPRAFAFDAYGTLFDVHAAAAKHSVAIGPNWERLSQTWRAKHLEYTWIHGTTSQRVSFWTLAERSLDYAAALHGPLTSETRAHLLAAYRKMATFPEVPGLLQRLKREGKPLAILSNGDPDMLADAVSSAGLNGVFDAVISVVDAATFKPATAVYQLAVDRLKTPANAIGFVSSNRWDVAGATAFGFETYWLNRANMPDEYPTMAPRRTIKTLDQLLTTA
jgi:2-haloacid dehalogenase